MPGEGGAGGRAGVGVGVAVWLVCVDELPHLGCLMEALPSMSHMALASGGGFLLHAMKVLQLTMPSALTILKAPEVGPAMP